MVKIVKVKTNSCGASLPEGITGESKAGRKDREKKNKENTGPGARGQ